jgi:hypothetical protein
MSLQALKDDLAEWDEHYAKRPYLEEIPSVTGRHLPEL